AWYTAPLVHLAPVARELELALITAFPEALIVVTPQGWMRTWTEPLPALVQPCRWLPPPALLRRITLLVVSIEDVAGDDALVASYARYCPLVVVTRGALGATLYQHGVIYQIAACPAQEYDPTGAGDVFAATMLVRLAETGDALAAAQFASAAAALVVEGRDLGNLTNREAVLARL
ncbi:MAG: ribokinase, partial [Chloroflexia bacterium]|nr:ribokinase [Chloroflexia bacterium]